VRHATFPLGNGTIPNWKANNLFMDNNLDDHEPVETRDDLAVDNPGQDAESPPEVIQRVENWRRRGLTISISGNRLRVQPWSKLDADDREFLKTHRAALKEAVRRGLPAEPRKSLWDCLPEPPTPLRTAPREPLPMVGGYQLVETDLDYALLNLGDAELEAYRRGDITRADAIARAVAAIEQRQNLPTSTTRILGLAHIRREPK
jgi:hypothetical protein